MKTLIKQLPTLIDYYSSFDPDATIASDRTQHGICVLISGAEEYRLIKMLLPERCYRSNGEVTTNGAYCFENAGERLEFCKQLLSILQSQHDEK